MATLLALLAAGCGAASTPAPTATSAHLGPLDQWFQANVWNHDADDAAADRQMDALVAQCMKDQGFTYLVADQAGAPRQTPAVPPGPAQGTRAFAQQYGYGIVWGIQNPPAGGSTEQVDPNQAILDAMSDTERDAYEHALQGVQADPPVLGATAPPYDWRTAGCRGSAEHQVEPAKAAYLDPTMVELQQEEGTIDATVDASPDVTDAAAAWSSCMSGAGYPGLATPPDAWNAANSQVMAVATPVPGLTESSEGTWHLEPADATRLQQQEIAVATADLDCRTSSHYDDVRNRMLDAQQQAFLDEHRTELEAWAQKYFPATP